MVGDDLTFTAPESVSVLWGLGDDATRKVVSAAHRAALGEALAFAEESVIRTRVGHAGARQVAHGRDDRGGARPLGHPRG